MDLGDVALAYWRLDEWVKNTNVERKTAATSSLRQIRRFLDDNGIEIKDFLGQQYDIGLATDVIAKTTEEDASEEGLVISETLAPLILEYGEILKFGQVVLGTEVKAMAPNNELLLDFGKSLEELSKSIFQICDSILINPKLAHLLR